MFRKSSLLAAMAVAAAFTLASADFADARSFGSRGGRTFQAPPATRTAPAPAQPIQRTQTTPQSAQPQLGAPQARPGLFGGGFAGSMMRGLMIGGLIGLLLGHGLGGLAGFFGLLLQAGLIVLAVMLVMRLFRRNQPAAAGGAPYARDGFPPAGAGSNGRSPVPGMGGAPLGGTPYGAGAPAGGAAGASGPAPYAPAASGPSDQIGLQASDYDTFERLQREILLALGRQDQGALHERATPEAFSFLADEMRIDADAGVKREISDVKMLQGDLAEAWREGETEYASVAIRYARTEFARNLQTGAIASGDPAKPMETTEVWTFTRPRGGQWVLAAIQEA